MDHAGKSRAIKVVLVTIKKELVIKLRGLSPHSAAETMERQL